MRRGTPSLVSFASTIGASIAFLVARVLLRDCVQNRFGDRLGAINRGVEITAEVADGPHSIILDQVTNGLAVRMATLWLTIGAHERDA